MHPLLISDVCYSVDREVAVGLLAFSVIDTHLTVTIGFHISLFLRKGSRMPLGSERLGSCLTSVRSQQHCSGSESLSHLSWLSTDTSAVQMLQPALPFNQPTALPT